MVRANGAKQWVQRIIIRGRRHEVGLGSILDEPSGQPHAGLGRAWCAGMQGVNLPAKPYSLTITIDSDDNGAGHKSATILAQRANVLGWKTALFSATKGFDWNDILKSGNA